MTQPSPTPRSPRPFVGILFRCCHVYARIYLNAAQTCYAGHCPRCAARIELRVASDGVSERFFLAE